MPLKLPFKRVCKKHLLPIVSRADDEREDLVCEKGHRCNGWLIVDSDNHWVGYGHKEESGEIFSISRPLPVHSKRSKVVENVTEEKPIPHRSCRYGHMAWDPFDDDGVTRYRCRTCQSNPFRRLKKEGKVKVVR